jgi:hypothetical protein
MARSVAIWIFGLIASAIIGGFVGSSYAVTFHPTAPGDGGFFGMVGGMSVFACLRLWLAAPRAN